jgi:hypothetical protein
MRRRRQLAWTNNILLLRKMMVRLRIRLALLPFDSTIPYWSLHSTLIQCWLTSI